MQNTIIELTCSEINQVTGGLDNTWETAALITGDVVGAALTIVLGSIIFVQEHNWLKQGFVRI